MVRIMLTAKLIMSGHQKNLTITLPDESLMMYIIYLTYLHWHCKPSVNVQP